MVSLNRSKELLWKSYSIHAVFSLFSVYILSIPFSFSILFSHLGFFTRRETAATRLLDVHHALLLFSLSFSPQGFRRRKSPLLGEKTFFFPFFLFLSIHALVLRGFLLSFVAGFVSTIFIRSGFAIDGKMILTNAHVVAHQTRVLVRRHGYVRTSSFSVSVVFSFLMIEKKGYRD